MDVEAELQALDRAVLTDLAHRSLGSDRAELVDWHHRRIAYSERTPISGGLYRVAGTARDGGAVVPWSLILKVVRSPLGGVLPGGDPVPDGWGTDPAHSHYWRREPLAYRSGLLADLPGGLAAPRCFGVVERGDESIWLWLEDVSDGDDAPWSLARYGLAARHLGQFNGAYLAGRPIPTEPWLGRGLLRAWSAQRPPDLVRDPANWEHPLLREAFPTPVAERILRLWAEREGLLEALDRLPQTLCHHDAFGANLFARRDAEGRERTVAIDWAFVGRGAVGEELVQLVAGSVLLGTVAPEDAVRLRELAIEGYVAGLRDAGWDWRDGDMEHAVRFGYAVSTALRWCFIVSEFTLRAARDEARRAAMERGLGRPIAETIARWAVLIYFLLDGADEVRTGRAS